jgi:hypothetical protein
MDMSPEQYKKVLKMAKTEGLGDIEQWSMSEGLARYVAFSPGRVILYAVDGEGNALIQRVNTDGPWEYLDGVQYRVVYRAWHNGAWLDLVAVDGFDSRNTAIKHAQNFVGKGLAMVTCQIGSRIINELTPYTIIDDAKLETYSALAGSNDPLDTEVIAL